VDVMAAVSVAVINFEGDVILSSEIEKNVKEILNKINGIVVVADKMMPDLMKIHENAQIAGSSSHDISKMKVAEFLITGNISEGKLNIKAVDVNYGTEIYNQTLEITGENSKRLLVKTVKDMSDKILIQSISMNYEIPSEAKPYMELINRLTESLGGSDETSYRYIALYSKGAYKHPDIENKKSADSARILLKIMRQDLHRAKLYYICMKADSSWTYIDVVVEKGGRKTKYKFGILETDDGSLGVGIYEESK